MEPPKGIVPTIRRSDLLFPELSYTINGVLIDVSKTLGGGHLEKYYQKAIAIGLKKRNLSFKEQVFTPLRYEQEKVGSYFLDFLIEDKIVSEIKRGKYISVSVIEQVKRYLSALNLKLAIIACFTYNGVVIKRIVNT